MPELNFQVTGVKAAAHGLTPLLQFQLDVRSKPETQAIQAVMLHAQIQIQCPQRAYTNGEKEKLVELFGQPERWGQTLRNKLWAISSTTVRGFTGRTETVLPVPCTFDMNVAATKYFHALEDGEAPLLFLFSGTVFYAGTGDRLQVEQISWNKECCYNMPLQAWHNMMNQHFPNSAWLYLHRGIFDRLCAYKRGQGFTSWDETIARLLDAEQKSEVAA
jgi:hypothetical protein